MKIIILAYTIINGHMHKHIHNTHILYTYAHAYMYTYVQVYTIWLSRPIIINLGFLAEHVFRKTHPSTFPPKNSDLPFLPKEQWCSERWGTPFPHFVHTKPNSCKIALFAVCNNQNGIRKFPPDFSPGKKLYIS